MNSMKNHDEVPVLCTHCREPLSTVYVSNAFERDEMELHYILCGCGNVMESVIEEGVITELFETPESYTKETAKKIRHAFEMFDTDPDTPSFEFFSLKGNVLIDKTDSNKNLLLQTVKNKLKGNTLEKVSRKMAEKGLFPNNKPSDGVSSDESYYHYDDDYDNYYGDDYDESDYDDDEEEEEME